MTQHGRSEGGEEVDIRLILTVIAGPRSHQIHANDPVVELQPAAEM